MNPFIAVFIIIFGAMFTQGVIGFGSGLISMPLLVAAIGLPTAAPLFALVALTAEGLTLIRYWGTFSFLNVRRLIIGAILGVPFGVFIVKQVEASIVLFILGLLLVSYALYSLIGARLPALKNTAWGFGFGFLGGILSGAYNTGGPPYVVYGTSQGWEPTQFKANLQGLFLVGSILVVATHFISHNITGEVVMLALVAIPAMLLGLRVGFSFDGRINPIIFRRMVLVLLLVLGLNLMF